LEGFSRFQEASHAFDDVAAQILALNRSDLPCMTMLLFGGPASADELAKALAVRRTVWNGSRSRDTPDSSPEAVVARPARTSPRRSIASIAVEVGLGTQSRFTTTFKRQTGFTPAVYRRGHH
jgi:AraC-like DNA-binding protein